MVKGDDLGVGTRAGAQQQVAGVAPEQTSVRSVTGLVAR
jgi:hypothetical protein